jgi:pimeloyl-ACP methyl ester carboxylesterase
MTTTHSADTVLHVETWGDGTPVVLVHGSLATGAEEWECQRPLAEEGFRLLVVDRRGYGHSPAPAGENYQIDADDLAELMGDGAHLVGHSYGGLGAMLAAARLPEATLSLTLLEAPVAVTIEPDPGWEALREQIRSLWDQDLPDDEWVVRFLRAVGSDPDQFPPEMLAVPLVPAAAVRSSTSSRHFQRWPQPASPHSSYPVGTTPRSKACATCWRDTSPRSEP